MHGQPHIRLTFTSFSNSFKTTCKPTEVQREFCSFYKQMNWLHHVIYYSKQLHARYIGWHKCLEFVFKYIVECRPFWISLLLFLVKLHITSLPFPSWHFHENLNSAPFAAEYSVHTMNTDVYRLCEVPATVNMHRAKCILSDAASHFIPNNSTCSLCNVCITKWEQITRDVRMSKNGAASLIRNDLALICTWLEIWHKMKLSMAVPN